MTVERYVPYALLALLMAVEIYAGRVRRTDAPARLDPSIFALFALIGGGYWLAFMSAYTWRAAGPRLGDWAVWTGAALAVAGAALRVWSVALLGRYFTYVVRVSADQHVVEEGPYGLIRHPSYTGALMLGVGIGLSTRYALAPLIILVTNLAGYLIRIHVEERALAEGIGEPYRAYMRRTRRLVPYVW